MSARIVTLTVNPAVDLSAEAESVQAGHKIRTFDERYDPGGGGINVARVIRELGGETLALFASGGVTGRFVEEMLTQAKVPWQAILIKGACRISVTVHDRATGQEYRFVPRGPTLTASDCGEILETLRHVEADWLVASGSLSTSQAINPSLRTGAESRLGALSGLPKPASTQIQPGRCCLLSSQPRPRRQARVCLRVAQTKPWRSRAAAVLSRPARLYAAQPPPLPWRTRCRGRAAY
jgi:hypothetical protein